MRMDRDLAAALAAWIVQARAAAGYPAWDPAATLHALSEAADRGDAWYVAVAAIKAAADPSNFEPGYIARDGAHWQECGPESGQPAPLPRRPWCRLCSAYHFGHEPHSRPRPRPPTTDYQREREQLRQRLHGGRYEASEETTR